MSYQINRVDIDQGEFTLSASIDNQLVLTLIEGKDWTVAPGADLGDLVTAGCALIDFLAEQATTNPPVKRTGKDAV